MDTSAHLVAFVNAFVVNARRERWLELVQNPGTKAGKNRDRLYRALDERYCERVESIDHLDPDRKCVVFDFRDPAIVTTLGEAIRTRYGRDIVISLVAGELAVHLFHHGDIWLCKKPKK